jgi:glycerophosphoryl diester phosphodiesterase
MRLIFFFVLLLVVACQDEAPSLPSFRLDLDGTELPAFFDFSEERIPLISAHRGGRFLRGYPENAMETMRWVGPQAPGLIECDVNMSSDSVLFLLHDDELDRTTTGTGPVSEKKWEEIKNLFLEDDLRRKTRFRPPTFEQVLDWAKEGYLLAVDVKRDIPFEKVVEIIQKKEAQNAATVITYTREDALLVHRLDSRLMISVTIESLKDLQEYLEAGLPADRLMAFTGLGHPDPNLYQALHAYGIPVTLATFRTVDRLEDPKERVAGYREIYESGVDIIATDRPLDAARALHAFWAAQEHAKEQFYVTVGARE